MSDKIRQFCKDMGYTETVTRHTCNNMRDILEAYVAWSHRNNMVFTVTGEDLDELVGIPTGEVISD